MNSSSKPRTSEIWLNIRRVYVLFTILFFVAALTVILNMDRLREARDDLIYDSKNHYLPCEKLPASAEVIRVISEHAETVRRIEQVNPGFIGVQIDTNSCPGRSDIVIWYATHKDRLAIEKIIDGDTFFGIGYRLINV